MRWKSRNPATEEATVLQLRNHIPISALARREPVDGTESDIRVSLDFEPAWYYRRCFSSFSLGQNLAQTGRKSVQSKGSTSHFTRAIDYIHYFQSVLGEKTHVYMPDTQGAFHC